MKKINNYTLHSQKFLDTFDFRRFVVKLEKNVVGILLDYKKKDTIIIFISTVAFYSALFVFVFLITLCSLLDVSDDVKFAFCEL